MNGNVIKLSYENFFIQRNNLYNKGFNVQTYYAENEENYDLRFRFEGWVYKTVILFEEIPNLPNYNNIDSRQKINEIENVKETILDEYKVFNEADKELFVKEVLKNIAAFKVISFE